MSNEADSLHADLAKANLLRLRGEFGEAELLCVKVLESSPENPSAHILLGDIAFAQDRADQAVEHYEIALQLDPTSPEVPRKLDYARARKLSRETASSVEQLGLPPRQAMPWSTLALAGFSLVCLATAIVIGIRSQKPKVVVNAVAPPIMAPQDALVPPPDTKSTSQTSGQTAPDAADGAKPKTASPDPSATSTSPMAAPTTPATVAVGTEDRAMFQLVQERSPLGSHLQAVNVDPRTKLVTLTYSVIAGEDPRHVGAELAKTTLDQSGDTQQITLRAIRDDRLVYMADMPRTRYADTLSDQWQHTNTAPDAWVAYSVVNEWPMRSPDSPEATPKTP